MSIVVVQQTPLGIVNSGAAGGAACSFTSLPTPGNAVIVSIVAFPNSGATWTAATAADNQSGNSYSQILFGRENISGNSAAFLILPSVVGSSGTFTVTPKFSPTAGSGSYIACAIEVSGLATSGYLDKTGTNSTNLTSLTASGSGANVNANDLVLALMCLDNAGSSVGISSPATTGYTSIYLNDNATDEHAQFSYKIVSAPETSSAHWTWTGSNTAIGIIATLEASGGGGDILMPQAIF